MSAAGRVYLVGAGPGDPGLLTVRAEHLLATADVVVHDYLVSRRLLANVRADAEVIAVGTSHADGARLTQEDIERVLVGWARAGRTVVRLKNGDPMVFGRGAEEAEALRSADVPFEIVPGVSSALAAPAYAGIPLTHRDHASLVTIATGHQACGTGAPSLPWRALATQGGTLVFLMGMRHLPALMARLVEHGLTPTTLAAAVSSGTTSRQRTVVATVATLADAVAGAGMGAPGVIVVGDVVGLRARTRWFEERPLFGRRIVVTRPRAQAAGFVALLEAQGADAVVLPTIALLPPDDPLPLARAVARAGTYDWIVFTSVNGVRAFFEAYAAAGRDVRALGTVQLAAIGPETAGELERRLLRPRLLPDDYRAEGLLAAFASEDLRGRRILLPRAAGARAILPETLAARGAHVEEVIAYRAVPPSDVDMDGLKAALAEGTIDALTFTSSSTVQNFVTLLGDDGVRTWLRPGRPVVACIGPVTADTARALGLHVDVVPAHYTVAALAAALTEHFCNQTTDPLCGRPG